MGIIEYNKILKEYEILKKENKELKKEIKTKDRLISKLRLQMNNIEKNTLDIRNKCRHIIDDTFNSDNNKTQTNYSVITKRIMKKPIIKYFNKEMTVEDILNDITTKNPNIIGYIQRASAEKEIQYEKTLITLSYVLGVTYDAWRIKETRTKAITIKRNINKKHCNKCGCFSNNLELHHIIPVEAGGDNSLDNLVLLCSECHKEENKNNSNYDKPVIMS